MRENDLRKYDHLHKRMLSTWQGSSPQPPNHQLDFHPTEPLRPAKVHVSLIKFTSTHYLQAQVELFSVSFTSLFFYANIYLSELKTSLMIDI